MTTDLICTGVLANSFCASEAVMLQCVQNCADAVLGRLRQWIRMSSLAVNCDRSLYCIDAQTERIA